MISTFGDLGKDGYIIDAVTNSGTTPISGIFEGADKFNEFGMQLITTGTIAGTWTIGGSNNHSTGGLNELAATGTFPDISSLLNAAFSAVTTGGSDQYRQMTFDGRAFKLTFTPTSGSGTVTAIIFAKSKG